jgi:hypothetical protein
MAKSFVTLFDGGELPLSGLTHPRVRESEIFAACGEPWGALGVRKEPPRILGHMRKGGTILFSPLAVYF